jgi:hypothetical protein
MKAAVVTLFFQIKFMGQRERLKFPRAERILINHFITLNDSDDIQPFSFDHCQCRTAGFGQVIVSLF